MELSIKVIPRAARTGFAGEMADGSRKLRVRAVPENGKANEEVCAFLATHFGVRREQVRIVSGATVQRKRIRIE